MNYLLNDGNFREVSDWAGVGRRLCGGLAGDIDYMDDTQWTAIAEGDIDAVQSAIEAAENEKSRSIDPETGEIDGRFAGHDDGRMVISEDV